MRSLLPHLFEVLTRLMHDDSREGNERDQVRDRHESIDDVGEHPDRLEFQKCTARDERDEDEAVRQNGTHAREVENGALTVVVPAENGGEREEGKRNGEEHAANAAVEAGERRTRHRRTPPYHCAMRP